MARGQAGGVRIADAAKPGESSTIASGHAIFPYLFTGPVVALIALVLAYPVLYGIYKSFFHHEVLSRDRSFVGFGNYQEILGSANFTNALLKSIVFVGGSITVGVLLGGFFAFALNRTVRGLRFLRGMAIIPYIVSSIAAAVIFRMVFNTEFGAPNQILTFFGFEPISWLSHPTAAMVAVIVTQAWTDVPLAILFILGGLQTIEPSYIDAAAVDGASGWKSVWHVSLPLIAPQLILTMILLSYNALTSLGVVLGLTGGGPGTSTETLPILMYRTGFGELNQGQALAIMVIIFAMNAVLSLIFIALGRRYNDI